jgi:hypothetical protein
MRQTPQPLQFAGRIFFKKIVIVTTASTTPGLSVDSTQAVITLLVKRHIARVGNTVRKYLLHKPDKLEMLSWKNHMQRQESKFKYSKTEER